jgi:hypothetical protein
MSADSLEGGASLAYARLRLLGIDPSALAHHSLQGGTKPLRFDSDGAASAYEPTIVMTNDLDELRAWHAPTGAYIAPPPRADAYYGTASTDVDDEIVRLTRIGYDYVFYARPQGSLDPGLKRAIEQTFAPFKTAVFAGKTIDVTAAAPLVITGSTPVAVVYGQMNIHPGGTVSIFAPGSMTITTLTKPSV